MKYYILILLSLFLTSCGTYRISTSPKVKIDKILTITSTGDTLAVPMRDFQRYNFNTYDFNRFNFNNSLYWNSWQHPYFGWGYGWNNWNSPFQPYYHDWWYRPIPNSTFIRPKVQLPKVPRVRVEGRRGQVTQPNNSLDNVVRDLRRRGVNVNEDNRIRVPRRSENIRTPRINNNNYSPAPRVRPTPPSSPQRTPRIQSTPNVQTRTSGGRTSTIKRNQ